MLDLVSITHEVILSETILHNVLPSSDLWITAETVTRNSFMQRYAHNTIERYFPICSKFTWIEKLDQWIKWLNGILHYLTGSYCQNKAEKSSKKLIFGNSYYIAKITNFYTSLNKIRLSEKYHIQQGILQHTLLNLDICENTTTLSQCYVSYTTQ